MNELKILFAGSMGAGKTTAIRAISDFDPISTEVSNTDTAGHAKESTTVGLDYGECRLGEDAVLRLYGTPGQERFGFMWDILGDGAFGLIVLADNSRPHPLEDIDRYLDGFAAHVPERRIVVGVGRTEQAPRPTLEQYCRHLAARGINVPVLSVDVRRGADVRLLLDVLVSMIEVDHA
jgi:uncharacterized protein